MKQRRYEQIVQVVMGKLKKEEITPPLNGEEKETLESMIEQDKQYFEHSGKHLVFEVPYGMFEEDFDNRKVYRGLYNESIDDYIGSMHERSKEDEE